MESSTLEAIIRLTARERLLIALSQGAATDESPDKLAALADTVRALDRLGAAHAVVGGVAVGVRSGVPRATLDTNVAVPSTVERGSLIEALTGAGFRLTGSFAHSINFRHPSGEPVQFVFDPAIGHVSGSIASVTLTSSLGTSSAGVVINAITAGQNTVTNLVTLGGAVTSHWTTNIAVPSTHGLFVARTNERLAAFDRPGVTQAVEAHTTMDPNPQLVEVG